MGFFDRVGEGVFGLGKAAFREAPVSAGLGLAAGAIGLGSGIPDFINSLDIGGGQADEAKRVMRNQEDFADMVAARDRAKQKARAENLARVAAYLPDTYNQVAAGRRLPQGAVVIGGRPRMDLLGALADSMSRGGM